MCLGGSIRPPSFVLSLFWLHAHPVLCPTESRNKTREACPPVSARHSRGSVNQGRMHIGGMSPLLFVSLYSVCNVICISSSSSTLYSGEQSAEKKKRGRKIQIDTSKNTNILSSLPVRDQPSKGPTLRRPAPEFRCPSRSASQWQATRVRGDTSMAEHWP